MGFLKIYYSSIVASNYQIALIAKSSTGNRKNKQLYTHNSRFLGEAAKERIPRSAQIVHDWGERVQPTKPKIRM